MNAMPILAWARTPVAPVGGALAACRPHELAAPLVARLLADAGLPASAVDAVVLGNALGAGGNPARLLALAAGLPEGAIQTEHRGMVEVRAKEKGVNLMTPMRNMCDNLKARGAIQ